MYSVAKSHYVTRPLKKPSSFRYFISFGAFVDLAVSNTRKHASLELFGTRDEARKEKKVKELKEKKAKEPKEKGESKVTLSRLLNFIDGLWSTCGDDKRIVFTTKHVEKLAPGLIGKGRMVMHVELGHSKVEAFMVLAKNYLEVEAHPLFEKVRELLMAVKISSADVVE
ncbi:hypothetical protein ZIOFF_031541 [Zingiber officinale]|uniref:AAA+ ATPase At3g28540-like C-terminal domain-containing protein n=1 Tax=Zingiber officinale TaxID=94328 RepID=A0A8J5GEZ0_ZINOF|nr:hypothetical protein ZIOFF_031541 [Zingiber officinale]